MACPFLVKHQGQDRIRRIRGATHCWVYRPTPPAALQSRLASHETTCRLLKLSSSSCWKDPKRWLKDAKSGGLGQLCLCVGHLIFGDRWPFFGGSNKASQGSKWNWEGQEQEGMRRGKEKEGRGGRRWIMRRNALLCFCCSYYCYCYCYCCCYCYCYCYSYSYSYS